MSSKFRQVVIGMGLIAILLGGFVPSTVAGSLGHWEIVHRIDYDELPEENLTGDITPLYRIFAVSMAGFHTDTFGIAIGPDDDVRSTTDGGQSWVRATGELYCRHGLDIVDAQVAWHCGNGGTRVSVDGGQTWRTVGRTLCPDLSFIDAQTGWAATPYRLQATTDGGTSWHDVTLPFDEQRIAAVALRTPADGYVLGTTGDLFVTADGGQSWEEYSLGLRAGEQLLANKVGPYTVMRFLDNRHGMVVFSLSDRTVWFGVTEDGGQSWQRAEIPELRDQATYYHLFLSHDAHVLTATDTHINDNVSVVLRYRDS